MVPPSSHRVSRVRRYSGYSWLPSLFAYKTVTFYGVPSHALLLRYRNAVYCPKPREYCYSRFSLFRVRSPLLTESRLISLPRPTSTFQFRRFPQYPSGFRIRLLDMNPAGLSHSDISGSKPTYGSPKLFAVSRVLHRLPVPRHSPCALCSLTMCFSWFFY